MQCWIGKLQWNNKFSGILKDYLLTSPSRLKYKSYKNTDPKYTGDVLCLVEDCVCFWEAEAGRKSVETLTNLVVVTA